MENKAIIALDHLKQLISADEIGGLSQDPSRSWDRTRILKDIVAAIEGCAEACDSVNEVPPVGANDKGKYLHNDETTGELGWAQASGGGGGGAVAHATYEIDETEQEIASIVLDMTVDEIVAAEGNVSVVANLGTPEHPFIVVGRVVEINSDRIKVIGIPAADPEDYYDTLIVFADTDELGHPVWYASGGSGPK